MQINPKSRIQMVNKYYISITKHSKNIEYAPRRIQFNSINYLHSLLFFINFRLKYTHAPIVHKFASKKNSRRFSSY